MLLREQSYLYGNTTLLSTLPDAHKKQKQIKDVAQIEVESCLMKKIVSSLDLLVSFIEETISSTSPIF